MTDSDWLSGRTPPPPEALAKAIRAALSTRNVADPPGSMELLETAQELLQKVLETDCAAREAALDLLTADALITYALEIGNEDAAGFREFPERALVTLAAAGESAGGEPKPELGGFK